ncbi:MAG TPA: hypothetical protein VGN14_07705 [Candidatus Elarobacter sp.]
MSERGVDLDALFDRDADARLLERRRRDELGLAPLPAPASTTSTAFGAESMVEAELEAYQRPASLRVTLAVRPEGPLIPGAVVTLVAEVHADGDLPVSGALARLTVSPEAEPVAGSFARDGIPLEGAMLLGEGVLLPQIPAGGVVRLRCALRILPGTTPIAIDAFVGAPGVPTIAPPALRLGRRSGHAAYEAPRPFFELEAGEVDEALGAPAAEPPRLVDAVVDEPVLPPPAPPAPALPPPPAPVAAQPPPPPPPPVALEIVLQRAFELDEVRALERLFAGAMPHGLANLTLLSSIAACDGPAGEALGLAAFTRRIAGALPRALVAARMSRPLPAVVDDAALAEVVPDAVVTPPGELPPGEHLLTFRLDRRELDALRAMLARSLDDPFLRGAQILLGVIPRALEGIAPDRAGPVREQLDRYRAAAAAWLVRATVRRKVDKRFDPLTAEDPTLFAAGGVLVTALREALA